MRGFVQGLILSAAALALLIGCGSSANTASPAASVVSSTAPPAGVQVTPTPTASSTDAPAPTSTPPAAAPPAATATAGESQPGGAGDEEAPTIDAEFTVSAGAITPTQVSVPAFFPIDLKVKNTTGVPLAVKFEAHSLTVSPGMTGHLHIDGLRKGRHPVSLGEGEATLVAGNDAGP